jgi:DNA-binding CsgD family transcriptional regulator/tetratricopeptide (TPR) repeat protein
MHIDGQRPELLERSEELAVLARLHDGVVRTSRGRVVVVSGEAGVGKTALVREFTAEASGSVQTWWGACDPLFTPHPLGPLVAIAESAGGELAAAIERSATPHDVAAAFARCLETPSIVVLEDMQWADEATLDVLRLLARRVETLPAMVLVTVRNDTLDRWHPLRIVLGELSAGAGVTRIPLAPLSRAGVARLAARDVADVDDLYTATAGNPFFVTEVLADGADDIPETVRDAVLARAARLSEVARALLDAIAVTRGRCELWLLDALVGENSAGLDEALGSGMIAAEPGGVVFRHELSRLTIEDAIPLGRRRELHRLAMNALDRRDGAVDPARIVHHAAAADDAAAVLRLAPLAAKHAAARGAHHEAGNHYNLALRFADSAPAGTRAELLALRARELWLIVHFDEAAQSQGEAVECYEALDDRRRQGAALTFLADLRWQAGSLDEGLATIARAVELLEEFPGRELAAAYGQRAQLLLAAEDPESAMLWARRAFDLALTIDDPAPALVARLVIGWVELFSGQPAGVETLGAVLDEAATAGIEPLIAGAYVVITRTAGRQRRYDLADQYLEPGIEFCITRDYDVWRFYLIGWRAKTAMYRGRWSEAARAGALCLADPCPFGRIHALAALGTLRARRGDPDPWELLDEALELAAPRHEMQWLVPVSTARAEAAWLEGRNDDALHETDAAWAMTCQRDSDWSAEVAYWRWRVGGAAPQTCRGEPAFVSEMNGDWQAARDAWIAKGCPYEAALATLDSADVDALQAALIELQALGARPAARIVANRLRSLGQRKIPRGPRATTRTNPANLTTRELEVLGLLADGLRNAEIGQRLFISEKTVDHHVTAVLGKLGASSRVQVAAKAAELGIEPRARAAPQ